MKRNVRVTDILIKLSRGELSGEELKRAKGLAEANPDLVELVKVAGELDRTRDDCTSSSIDGESLKQLARTMFRDYHKGKNNPESQQGVTVYDSRILPLPDGVRPAVVDVRKLRYKLGDWEVELALYPITVDSLEVMGQITGPESGRQLEITLQHGRRRFSATTDDFYLFRFPRVPTSEYQLSISEHGKLIGRIDLKP